MRGEQTQSERRLAELIRERETAESSVALVVTILGDGRDTPEYGKREELLDRLSTHDFVREVTIPELLLDAHPNANLDEVERSAIETADLVICLEGPNNPPLGLYTEVLAYLESTDLEKWYRLEPWDRDSGAGSEPLVSGLAQERLRRVETQHYERAAWESCERITAACFRRVDLVRLRLVDRSRSG